MARAPPRNKRRHGALVDVVNCEPKTGVNQTAGH